MWRYLRPLVQAAAGSPVSVASARVRVPGPLKIRLSVVASNIRLHRLMAAAATPGATVVDVGANTGYNTVYAAALVGPHGRVVAVEPAADNARVLRDNIAANGLSNVAIHTVAAGRRHETRELFLRGDLSAVNSLFAESVYATVTGVDRVPVAPLDALVDGDADLVKIDVEGAELDALAGMTRLLRSDRLRVIVEWHPRLQEAAGYSADALPRCLLEHGFGLQAVSHTRSTPLTADGIDAMASRLRRSGSPVELVGARRPARR
jgi:FkbM family methyltransferase